MDQFVKNIYFKSSKSEISSSDSSPPSSPLSGNQSNEHEEGKSPSSDSSVTPETQSSPEPLPCMFPHDDEDVELISFFLAKKVFNERVRFNILIEKNPFEDDPDKLQLGWSSSSKIRVRGYEGYYFFTVKEPTQSNQTEADRCTTNGCWSPNGEEMVYGKTLYTLGFRREWEFYWRKESDGEMLQNIYWKKAPNGSLDLWLMHEYRLNTTLFELYLPETIKDALLHKAQTYRLCRIQRFECRDRGE